MDLLTVSDLRTLSHCSGKWCVSIFMPTHPTWPANNQDRIRFDKLVSEAGTRLITLGERPTDVRQRLAPLEQLMCEKPFWQQQRWGLAAFLAPDLFETYRLPIACSEMVMVADRVAIRPLLPLATKDARFFVLAISKQNVRLVRASRFEAEEIHVPNLPQDVDEATGLDEPERGIQFHAGVPVGKGRQRAAVMHTSGVRVEDEKEYIREYCQQINQQVTRVLRKESVPLVLAGVESTLAIYRQANTYQNLLDAELRGATERQSEHDLRERAWPLIEKKHLDDREPMLRRFRQGVGTGKASVDLKDILIHAHDGMVSDLFVQDDGAAPAVWGRYDHNRRQMTLYAQPEGDDEDLIDLAAVQTMRHGGMVYALPHERMPLDVPIAALYRY